MDLEIQTRYGKVKGFTEDGINKWYGIPYAKPPVGELRFRRAVECESWDGIVDCTKFKGRCIQFDFPCPILPTDSEDCLHLNIWRNNNKDEKNLPVYVWIHGGSYRTGSGIDEMYHGESFAKNGILYITINYRLGTLGYYDFSLYSKDLYDSNCFLSDQIMALKWIKENIEAFGGDPNNVTLAGESAGSCSVCLLMASPAAKGLFHKAICQSGPPKTYKYFKEQPKMNKIYLDQFLKELHLQPDKDIKKIRELNIEDIRKIDYKMNKSDDDDNIFSISPIVFDDLLPKNLFDGVKAGEVTDIKLIIGTTHDEGTYLYSMEECPMNWNEIRTFCKRHGLLSKYNDFKNHYGQLPTEAEQCCEFITDYQFLINSCFIADALSQWNENEVWMYRFDYPPPLFEYIELNATHGCDIYISANQLENKRGKSIYGDAEPNVLKYLVDSMHGSFVQFAKTGNPNGSHLDITWEKYDSETRKTFIFNERNELVVIEEEMPSNIYER